MSGRWKIKYGGAAAFVGSVAWLYVGLRDFAGATPAERYRMLSDAFTVPGVLLLMLGCLIWISNLGALDGISYAIGAAVRSFVPGGRHGEEAYGDYTRRKRENKIKGYGFLFLSGGVTMAIAVVFTALFYNVY